jgi:hypothetical protein
MHGSADNCELGDGGFSGHQQREYSDAVLE